MPDWNLRTTKYSLTVQLCYTACLSRELIRVGTGNNCSGGEYSRSLLFHLGCERNLGSLLDLINYRENVVFDN